jgi:hypothetical protein
MFVFWASWRGQKRVLPWAFGRLSDYLQLEPDLVYAKLGSVS